MDKLVTYDFTKTLIILSVALMAISALLTKMIAKVTGSFKPHQKATIIYVVVFLLFFATIACTASFAILKNHFLFFILYQFYFLLLGIAHTYYMPAYLQWSRDSKAVLFQLMFTIIAGAIGGIGFIVVYKFFNAEGLHYSMATSVCTFIIPWFVYQTFQRAIAIPPKVLKQWFYPLHEELEEPDESKLKNLLVISFEFQKQTSDLHLTNFRAKAPADMEFGELFYYFVNDYNERHPNSKIQFSSGSGAPHGWIFYKKPKWYTISTQYINSERSIFNNNIKENDIIICSRSLN
jgi:hypothetical protein